MTDIPGFKETRKGSSALLLSLPLFVSTGGGLDVCHAPLEPGGYIADEIAGELEITLSPRVPIKCIDQSALHFRHSQSE